MKKTTTKAIGATKVVKLEGSAKPSQKGIPRSGAPSTGVSNESQKLVTMQLFSTINMRRGEKTQHELALTLGLGSGLAEDKGLGTYFSRYLNGRNAMQPDDLQQVAMLAIKKGLLRSSDTPRQLTSSIESLLGAKDTLLSETVASINKERGALTAARAAVINALSDLQVTMSECKAASIAHTVEDGQLHVSFEGVGVDLESVRRQFEASYVCVQISRPVADLLPDLVISKTTKKRRRSGTNPAQSASQTKSTNVVASRKKTKSNQ